MKRNKKEEKFKEFLRKKAMLDKNREAQNNLGFIPLDEPVHCGYNAKWELREDISRRKDADQFQYILDNFGTTVWCKRKEFKVWDRYYKKMIDVNPGLREIDQNKYDNLSVWAQKFFYSYEKQNSWGGATRTVYSVNIPSYLLVKKVVKSYKTHYRELDETLLQEEAEIWGEIYLKYHDINADYWSRCSSFKSGQKIFNKKDRRHNKVALHKNMGTEFAKYDDISDDWGSWLNDWVDDFYEFRYKHRRGGRWIWD